MITFVISSLFWISEPLAESYEIEVLEAMHIPTGTKTLAQYREEFDFEYLEVQRDLKIFRDIEELKTWIRTQVPSEAYVEEYLAIMREKKWIELEDGAIAFPTRRILAKVVKP
jgi:hypothetical protein